MVYLIFPIFRINKCIGWRRIHPSKDRVGAQIGIFWKLSIAEMGGNPFWMGPLSSMYIDGRGEKESAVITRKGNKYSFLKLQNNILVGIDSVMPSATIYLTIFVIKHSINNLGVV